MKPWQVIKALPSFGLEKSDTVVDFKIPTKRGLLIGSYGLLFSIGVGGGVGSPIGDRMNHLGSLADKR